MIRLKETKMLKKYLSGCPPYRDEDIAADIGAALYVAWLEERLEKSIDWRNFQAFLWGVLAAAALIF